MSEWAPRVFWKEVQTREGPEGHAVLLDGRPLRTPARVPLVLPTRALAEAVASEWRAQNDILRPETMPHTRTANTALDRVAPRHGAVVADLAAYGANDLLCYRATAPQELADRQARAWNPLLAWAEAALDAPLCPVSGVMPVTQPAASLACLETAVAAHGPFPLAALHELVTLSGSLLLGLAVSQAALAPGQAWALSRLDEEWQAEMWGRDDEAESAAAQRRQAFLRAADFLNMCNVLGPGERHGPA